MTARQALASLVAEGLVERRRGSGTFVARRTLHRQPGLLLSFSEEIRRRGMRPSSRLITAAVEPARPDEVRDLALPPDGFVVRVVRVRYADDVPMAIESTVLVPDLAGVLDADLEGGSLHEAVARLGVQPAWQAGWLSARLASGAEQRLLGLGGAAAVLSELAVGYDTTGRPFERTETAYVGDRYAVDTIHSRDSPLLPDGASQPGALTAVRPVSPVDPPVTAGSAPPRPTELPR